MEAMHAMNSANGFRIMVCIFSAGLINSRDFMFINDMSVKGRQLHGNHSI